MQDQSHDIAEPRQRRQSRKWFPRSPHDAEKLMYLNTHRWMFNAFAVFSSSCLIVGLWMFVRADTSFYWFGAFVALLSAYMTLSLFAVSVWGKDFDYDEHETIRERHANFRPTVDVFLPCCGEPLDVLRNTWNHVAKIEYPVHLVNVYVLDDSASPYVMEMAKEFGYRYLVRTNRPELRKAGNLRHAFSRSSGDIIVILDADFCPRTDFLKDVLPYFEHDQRIAVLQTPQFFKVTPDHQTWVEQGAGAVQELFYRLVQVNRNRWGGSICVGTCGAYRRQSLLPFGGTAAIGYSEDVHTGFNVVNDGWKVMYVPLNLAMGICPDNVESFFVQQYRWCMGSITLFANPAFWKSTLTVMQKACYLTGMMYYIVTALQVFVNPLPAILLIYIKPEGVLWYNVLFVLPSLLNSSLGMWLWNIQPYNHNVVQLKVIQSYAHLFAIKDKIANTLVEWQATGSGTPRNTKAVTQARWLSRAWVPLTTALIVAGSVYRLVQGYTWYAFIPSIALSTMPLGAHARFMINC